MLLPSKTVYGVQALFDLAVHGQGRAVQAREVADRQNVPLRYLEQILRDLRRAGLVAARRGPRGGYALARPPQDVRLGDVVSALDRTRGTARKPGVSALVLRELLSRIETALAAMSLKDLVARADALGLARPTPAPQMYFI